MSETMMNGPSHSDATPAPPPLAQAVSLHLEGRRREALEVIEGALASGGNSPELFSADALIRYELGLFADAAESYRRLLATQPDHPTATLNLAICLERTGNWKEAAEAFGKTAEKDPNRVEAHAGVAICHLQ